MPASTESHDVRTRPLRRRARGGPTDPSHDADLRRGDHAHRRLARRRLGAGRWPFLLAIYAIPIGQAILEKRAATKSVLLDLFRQAPTREHLRQFEDDLDKASYRQGLYAAAHAGAC